MSCRTIAANQDYIQISGDVRCLQEIHQGTILVVDAPRYVIYSTVLRTSSVVTNREQTVAQLSISSGDDDVKQAEANAMKAHQSECVVLGYSPKRGSPIQIGSAPMVPELLSPLFLADDSEKDAIAQRIDIVATRLYYLLGKESLSLITALVEELSKGEQLRKIELYRNILRSYPHFDTAAQLILRL